jgi:inorganic pyrophosphatase
MGSLIELASTPAAGIIHVVIESPRGATAKIKYDSGLGAFTLSRPLPLGLWYPHDWGFVPGTRAEDGDPVDALVLSEGSSYPGLVIEAVPIALVTLEQDRKGKKGRERNDRIIAVPEKAPRAEYRKPGDLPARVRDELTRFFLDAVFFEDKHPRVLGWEGPEQALALVTRSRGKGKKRR